MKVVNCTKCNEEYAINLNKPDEWYCPYCDNLYSFITDKLSVEKLQEQLNSKDKSLTEIRANIEEHNQIYDLDVNTAPQLTIPKSIAGMLDKIPNETKRYVQENGFDDYSILDDFVELREFYEADENEVFTGFTGLKEFVKQNLNLCALYLAGKPLGVDLVKVVEG